MKFLFYDVETANSNLTGSICAVGWLKVQGLEILDQGYSLINPNCPFSPVNTKIHGITEQDVVDAPSFSD